MIGLITLYKTDQLYNLSKLVYQFIGGGGSALSDGLAFARGHIGPQDPVPSPDTGWRNRRAAGDS